MNENENESVTAAAESSVAYPEHEKVQALDGANIVVGAFIEWMQNERGWVIARWDEHDRLTPVRGMFSPPPARHLPVALQNASNSELRTSYLLTARYPPDAVWMTTSFGPLPESHSSTQVARALLP